MPFLTANQFS